MSKCNQLTTWLIGCDNQVVIDAVAYQLSGDYINTATIEGQLYEGEVTVLPPTNTTIGAPIVFRYQTASNGKYLGAVLASLALVQGTVYTLVVTITTLKSEVHVELIKRTANFDQR